MTVTDIMAKSHYRRARLFRVQMSTGRNEEWDLPGDSRGRPPTCAASAGVHSMDRGGGPSRMGMASRAGFVDVPSAVQEYRTDSPAGLRRSTDTLASRAKTAPAARHPDRSSSTPTPKPESRLGVAGPKRERSVSPFHRRTPVPAASPAPHPKLVVVQLEMQQGAASRMQQPRTGASRSRANSVPHAA
jgi:hypothetical protein